MNRWERQVYIKHRITKYFQAADQRKLAGIALLAAGAAGLAALIYSHKVEPEWLETTYHPLVLPRLDPAFHGYRVVQISDIHMDRWMNERRLKEIVERVNLQAPDLVVITGDFVTHKPEKYAPAMVAALRQLWAHDGVMAVFGNHDHWADEKVVRQVIEDSGIIDLNNRVHTLRRGDAQLHFAGVDDFMADKACLEDVLKEIPGEGAAVLLAHEPDFADVSAPTGRFDLQLSGHSHGGQIVLPVVGAPFLPGHAEKYPEGLYYVDDMLLYTNRGLGMVHLKFRLNSRPELSVFTLESGMEVGEEHG